MSIDDLIARKQLEDWEKDLSANFCIHLKGEYVGWANGKPNSYKGKLENSDFLEKHNHFFVTTEGRDAKLRCLFTLRNLNYARNL